MTDGRHPRPQLEQEDDAPAGLRLTKVRPPGREPHLAGVAWIVTALVLVAVLKPWSVLTPSTPSRPDLPLATVEVTPVPTIDRSAAGLAASVCLGTGGWRIASLERWRDGDVRVWRAIEPVETAAGPLDVEIPSVPVTADTVTALGWCAPAYGPDQPIGPADVQAWLVAGPRVTVIGLRRVQPDGTTPIAALYQPLRGAWASGRVVFRYEDRGTDRVRWFAADLEVRNGPAPSGAALPTPGWSGSPSHGPGWSQAGASP